MRTIATVGGLGYSPIAPGTLGSAVGLGIMGLLSGDPLHQLLGSLVAVCLALWSAGPTAKAMGKADPPQIVIDEVAGIMVALTALPVTVRVYGLSFLLFRFLDIVKPPPIRQLQRLPGSWGIVLDDLGAGIGTHLLLRAILPLFSR